MTKTINSNGICGYCFNKTITYSIEDGSYMYFCSTCCKNIFSNYVLTESEAEKQKEHNRKLLLVDCPTKGVHQNVQEIINCPQCAELIDKLSAKTLGSRGGKKRAENSTPEQRKEWGKKGGRPRKITKDNV